MSLYRDHADNIRIDDVWLDYMIWEGFRNWEGLKCDITTTILALGGNLTLRGFFFEKQYLISQSLDAIFLKVTWEGKLYSIGLFTLQYCRANSVVDSGMERKFSLERAVCFYIHIIFC